MKKTVIAITIVFAMLFGTAFAAASTDPSVNIVSPGQTVYGNNLLISVKITAPKTVRISAFEQKEMKGNSLSAIDVDQISSIEINNIKSVAIMETQTFTCPDNLRFYSKQINGLTPGLYKIVVETKTGDKTTATTSTLTVVRPAGQDKSVSFKSQQQGALQWLQKFLKSIFGS